MIDASVLLPDEGSIAGTLNSVLMKVEFYDVFNGQFHSDNSLGQTQIVVAGGTSAAGARSDHRIDEVAPVGAIEARLVFVYSRSQNQNGAVLVDNVRLRVAESLAADFNQDGVVDAAVYTVWRDGFGATFTQADYADWASNLGATSAQRFASFPEPSAALVAFVTYGVALWSQRPSLAPL